LVISLNLKKNVKEITIARFSYVCILIENLKKHRLYGAKYLDFYIFVEVLKK
jgi:hypothetical protein